MNQGVAKQAAGSASIQPISNALVNLRAEQLLRTLELLSSRFLNPPPPLQTFTVGYFTPYCLVSRSIARRHRTSHLRAAFLAMSFETLLASMTRLEGSETGFQRCQKRLLLINGR